MRRRALTERLIPVLGLAVIALGALIALGVLRGERFGFREPPATERALQQLRSRLGPRAELRYAEQGHGRVLCGYGGRPGEPRAVAFVSRPNRILFADDPLPREFDQLIRSECPGFNRAPTP